MRFELVYIGHTEHIFRITKSPSSPIQMAIYTHTFTHTSEKNAQMKPQQQNFLDAERMKSKIVFFYCLLTIRARIHMHKRHSTAQHNSKHKSCVYVCVCCCITNFWVLSCSFSLLVFRCVSYCFSTSINAHRRLKPKKKMHTRTIVQIETLQSMHNESLYLIVYRL